MNETSATMPPAGTVPPETRRVIALVSEAGDEMLRAAELRPPQAAQPRRTSQRREMMADLGDCHAAALRAVKLVGELARVVEADDAVPRQRRRPPQPELVALVSKSLEELHRAACDVGEAVLRYEVTHG